MTSAPAMVVCVKGRFGWLYLHHADRLTRPLVRRSLLGEEPRVQGLRRAGRAYRRPWRLVTRTLRRLIMVFYGPFAAWQYHCA